MSPAMLPGSPLYALQTQPAAACNCCAAPRCSARRCSSSPACGFLPIAEASATGFVAPLFVTALSIVFLGEKVGLRRWIATAVGLIGVHHHPAAGHRRVSSRRVLPDRLGAGLGLHADHDADDERHRPRHHHHDLFVDRGRLHLSPRWCRSSGSRRPGTTSLFGVLIGVASTAGQWIVVLAFRYADASVLAPFSYTQLLWVSILGFLIFGEVPDAWTITGAAFIVAQRPLHRPSRAGQAVAAVGGAGRAVAERLIQPVEIPALTEPLARISVARFLQQAALKMRLFRAGSRDLSSQIQ